MESHGTGYREQQIRRLRLASLASLAGLGEKHVPGPSPGFAGEHAVFIFLIIGEEEPVSRQALATKTGLGEGSVRTILRKLRREGLVTADSTGCHLTGSGKRLFGSVNSKLSSPLVLGKSPLTVGASQTAVLVRGASSLVGNGIEQRDSTVKLGASGATTYVVKGRRFSIPGGSEDCERDFPDNIWAVLRGKLKPHSKDVIVVCGAKSQTTATLGALAAALTLV